MQPDLDGLRAALRGKPPGLVVLGTSRPLFPESFADIASVVRESGGKLLYDGAHLLGLIAAGAYPNPLREGFDVLSGSTHKTLPGPTGGLIVCTTLSLRDQAAKLTDSWLSTYSASRLAALTYVLAEMEAIGADYGRHVVANARALGAALADNGFTVVGAKRGFTKTHQVLVDVTALGRPQETAPRLAAAGVLVNGPSRADRRVRNAAEDGLWLRLGTSAATRQGMGAVEMADIASILARALIAYEDPAGVRRSVDNLLRCHRTVAFTLDAVVPA
jgi:glycine hydroxymethyltransferase